MTTSDELRTSAAIAILEAMTISRQINDANPLSDMLRCWRWADKFVEAGSVAKQVEEAA